MFAEIASLDAIYHGTQEREQLVAHVMVPDQIVEMICHTGPGPYEWCLLENEKNE